MQTAEVNIQSLPGAALTVLPREANVFMADGERPTSF
jgi:hypothetical protein